MANIVKPGTPAWHMRHLFKEQFENALVGRCANCGGEVGEFRDELSRKEFGISGDCQKCQDEFFGNNDK